MEDQFIKKVRTAAVAGWWTLLIAYGLITIQWLVYLFIVSNKQDWMLTLWGLGVTWSTVSIISIWGIAIIKICLLIMVVVTVWLTLWARGLSRSK